MDVFMGMELARGLGLYAGPDSDKWRELPDTPNKFGPNSTIDTKQLTEVTESFNLTPFTDMPRYSTPACGSLSLSTIKP